MDIWPKPLSVDARSFDRQAMQQVAKPVSPPAADPSAPVASAADAAGATGAIEEPADPQGQSTPTPTRVGVGEKLATSLVLVIPLLSALVVVLCWMQYRASSSGLWLGIIAVVLVVAALLWISSVKKAFARAQGHLAQRLPGVVGYGVGIVTAADVDSPIDENGVSETVDARLTVKVNPTQGPGFTGTLEATYATADAQKLVVGAHGPVRYLRSDPAGTLQVETRLSDDGIQRVYQAAAMN